MPIQTQNPFLLSSTIDTPDGVAFALWRSIATEVSGGQFLSLQELWEQRGISTGTTAPDTNTKGIVYVRTGGDNAEFYIKSDGTWQRTPRILKGAAEPTNAIGENGDLYFNTSDQSLYVRGSMDWTPVAGGFSIDTTDGTPTGGDNGEARFDPATRILYVKANNTWDTLRGDEYEVEVTTGMPLNTIGDNGDARFDPATGTLYIKTEGQWRSVLSDTQTDDKNLIEHNAEGIKDITEELDEIADFTYATSWSDDATTGLLVYTSDTVDTPSIVLGDYAGTKTFSGNAFNSNIWVIFPANETLADHTTNALVVSDAGDGSIERYPFQANRWSYEDNIGNRRIYRLNREVSFDFNDTVLFQSSTEQIISGRVKLSDEILNKLSQIPASYDALAKLLLRGAQATTEKTANGVSIHSGYSNVFIDWNNLLGTVDERGSIHFPAATSIADATSDSVDNIISGGVTIDINNHADITFGNIGTSNTRVVGMALHTNSNTNTGVLFEYRGRQVMRVDGQVLQFNIGSNDSPSWTSYNDSGGLELLSSSSTVGDDYLLMQFEDSGDNVQVIPILYKRENNATYQGNDFTLPSIGTANEEFGVSRSTAQSAQVNRFFSITNDSPFRHAGLAAEIANWDNKYCLGRASLQVGGSNDEITFNTYIRAKEGGLYIGDNRVTAIPSGGAVGDVIRKNSLDNYDIGWAQPNATVLTEVRKDLGTITSVINLLEPQGDEWSFADLPVVDPARGTITRPSPLASDDSNFFGTANSFGIRKFTAKAIGSADFFTQAQFDAITSLKIRLSFGTSTTIDHDFMAVIAGYSGNDIVLRITDGADTVDLPVNMFSIAGTGNTQTLTMTLGTAQSALVAGVKAIIGKNNFIGAPGTVTGFNTKIEFVREATIIVDNYVDQAELVGNNLVLGRTGTLSNITADLSSLMQAGMEDFDLITDITRVFSLLTDDRFAILATGSPAQGTWLTVNNVPRYNITNFGLATFSITLQTSTGQSLFNRTNANRVIESINITANSTASAVFINDLTDTRWNFVITAAGNTSGNASNGEMEAVSADLPVHLFIASGPDTSIIQMTSISAALSDEIIAVIDQAYAGRTENAFTGDGEFNAPGDLMTNNMSMSLGTVQDVLPTPHTMSFNNTTRTLLLTRGATFNDLSVVIPGGGAAPSDWEPITGRRMAETNGDLYAQFEGVLDGNAWYIRRRRLVNGTFVIEYTTNAENTTLNATQAWAVRTTLTYVVEQPRS